VSYGKLGFLHLRMGEPEKARVALVTGRSIIARLDSEHPGFVQWEKDVAWFDQMIAETGT
jgi:hypothetical protein